MKKLSTKVFFTSILLSLGFLNFVGFDVNAQSVEQKATSEISVGKLSEQVQDKLSKIEEKINNADAEYDKKIENVKAEIVDTFNKLVDKQNFKNGPFDPNQYVEVAKKLYKEVVGFIEKSDKEGVTAEQFSDYIENFLRGDKNNKPLVLSGSEFDEHLGRNEKMLRLYRGINGEWFDKFRNGEVFMGSRNTCSFYGLSPSYSCGHAIYATPDKGYAQDYCQFPSYKFEKNEELKLGWPKLDESIVGGVAELAVDMDKVKWIDHETITRILYTMLYMHPEKFGCIEMFDKKIPVGVYYSFQYQNIFRPAFQETFGFDFNDIAEHLSKDPKFCQFDRGGNLDEYLTCFLSDISDIGCGLTVQFNEKLDKLMRENKTKAHFVDKFCTVVFEEGLLAKLLGYNTVCLYQKQVDFNDPNLPLEQKIETLAILDAGLIVICKDRSHCRQFPETLEEAMDMYKKAYAKFLERKEQKK